MCLKPGEMQSRDMSSGLSAFGSARLDRICKFTMSRSSHPVWSPRALVICPFVNQGKTSKEYDLLAEAPILLLEFEWLRSLAEFDVKGSKQIQRRILCESMFNRGTSLTE